MRKIKITSFKKLTNSTNVANPKQHSRPATAFAQCRPSSPSTPGPCRGAGHVTPDKRQEEWSHSHPRWASGTLTARRALQPCKHVSLNPNSLSPTQCPLSQVLLMPFPATLRARPNGGRSQWSQQVAVEVFYSRSFYKAT